MPQRNFNQIRRRLLAWYQRNHRDLPWRRTRDPYAIWIAETMLQQTQVKSALPYYRRFLKAFPTIGALDRAAKGEILALWSGLGYYRRAENLKRSARIIMREHRGRIPRDFASLRALPGVGPYTAGALMSIAFNQPHPTLDGNTRRVLSRIFDLKRERDVRGIGKNLVAPSRPGDFNQALMELGSTTCLPRDPSCPLCPMRPFCSARKSRHFQLKAPSAARRRIQKVEWPLVVIQNNQKILLRRRPAGGLLGGLWEVPGGEREKGESPEETLTRHLNGLGKIARPASFVGEVRHSITYRKIRAPVFFFSYCKQVRLPHPGWRWTLLSSLERYPLSSLSLKAIRLATQR